MENIVYLKGLGFIVNNFLPSPACVKRLNIFCDKAFLSIKLIHTDFDRQCQEAKDQGFKHIAIDAENYNLSLTYDKKLGADLREFLVEMGFETIAVLPENLGGAKYKNYDAFLKGLKPDLVLMERTYSQPEWYNIIYFYLRNVWLRFRFHGAKIFVGIWLENVPADRRDTMEKTAKFISGDKVFWYSETKSLPKYE